MKPKRKGLKESKREEDDGDSEAIRTGFRERRWGDILAKPLRHPRKIPGYRATLPGALGWQVKEDPGK